MPQPRAVELIRVSTQEQADRDTPELQRRALDELRARRPCVVVARIEELGVSGALPVAQRAKLRQLEELAAAKAFDELRVYAVDRLTRAENLRERVVIWGLAQDAGAVIVDASGTVYDPASAFGEIGYYLHTFAATQERKRIIVRTAAGRKRAAEEGRLSQGLPPYGRKYDHALNSWVLVPSEVEVYRRIIEEVSAGASTREVASGLNQRGVPARKAGAWGASTIKRLLRTEAIVGRYRVCGRLTEIPPIIDESTWARARAALTKGRSSTGPAPKLDAIMRGLLLCGCCGARLHVLSDGAGRSCRYACPPSRRRAGAKCSDRQSIAVWRADAAAREALVDCVGSAAALRAAVEAGREQLDGLPTESDAKALEVELAKLAGQQARLLRLLDDGLLSEVVARERLGQIKAATQATEEQRVRMLASLDDSAHSPDLSGLEASAADFGRAVSEANPSRLGELLRILVPPREPYGLRLYSGRIEMVGRLPMFEIAGELAIACSFGGQSSGARSAPIRLTIPLMAGAAP